MRERDQTDSEEVRSAPAADDQRPKTITLSRREVLLIQQAFHGQDDNLRAFVRWIDDRPMLPARKEAVAKILAECREMADLRLKLYEAFK